MTLPKRDFRWYYDLIGDHWKPLLLLALYDASFFHVPIWLKSEAGWALRRVSWEEPIIEHLSDEDATEVPCSTYDVCAEQMSQFRRFLRIGEEAVEALGEHPRLRLAARRYLRAMFVAGPIPSVADPDEMEEALLQYVFALETLLLGGEQEAIADKIAMRAAHLVGSTDDTRAKAFRDVKSLYGQRSRIVHGSSRTKGKPGKGLELEQIRDLTRRVLIAALALRMRVHSNCEWQDGLQKLPLARVLQEKVRSASGRMFALMAHVP